MQRLLKLEEAAALLGISPSTLANWRAAGTGPPWLRVGGVKYDPVKLAEWVVSQERSPQIADTESRRQAEAAILWSWSRAPQNCRLGGHRTQADRRAEKAAAALIERAAKRGMIP